jgi:hypothetical protein
MTGVVLVYVGAIAALAAIVLLLKWRRTVALLMIGSNPDDPSVRRWRALCGLGNDLLEVHDRHHLLLAIGPLEFQRRAEDRLGRGFRWRNWLPGDFKERRLGERFFHAFSQGAVGSQL